MKITWLGQGGLMLETQGKTVLVDPYLSDSVAKINPKNARRIPIDESFWSVKPDVLLFTHDHLDHLDLETVAHYLPNEKTLVFAPKGGCEKIRAHFATEPNRVVRASSGLTWTEEFLTVRAVFAAHSDPESVGYILTAEGENYYVTGDTLYHEAVFQSLPKIPLKAVFLPINGVGNNMNAIDAAAFARRTKATYAVPLHFGLFDNVSPEAFLHPRRILPQIYQEIPFP